MKKSIVILLLVLTALMAGAQAPQGINYQTVVRNVSGAVLPNTNIGIKIVIHSGNASGSVVYAETHVKTTNQFGLVNLVIGQGTVVSGTFSLISWGTNSYYAETLIDPTGGTNYTSLGSQQLMSVPYALYASKTTESQTLAISGNNLSISGGNTVILPTGAGSGANNLRQVTQSGFVMPAAGIGAMAATTDGQVLIVALVVPNNPSGLFRLEKDPSGIYHVTHFLAPSDFAVTSMTILGSDVYIAYQNPTGNTVIGVKRVSVTDLSGLTNMTFNPSVPALIGVLSNDGTNLFVQTNANISFSNDDWASYHIVSTALINNNQDFSFLISGSGMYLGGEYCVYDGSNYYVSYYNNVSSTRFMAKFNASKTYVSQSSDGGAPAVFSSTHLLYGGFLSNGMYVNYPSNTLVQMPIIITTPFDKP